MTEPWVAMLNEKITAMLPELRALRHRIHQEPELHFEEVRTRAKVVEALAGLPLRMREPLLGTDLIADLDAGRSRTIALRADMDALPIHEQTGKAYASRVAGKMHACGHDGHTAILVGVARILCEVRERLPVNVRFVFQPAEEMVAGGKDLVARGALEGVDAAYALHGCPGLPAGTIGSRVGAMNAAGDFFDIHILGRGGHGAMPEQARSPMASVGRLLVQLDALHQQIHREHQAVLSVCSVRGGSTGNVIPDQVRVLGTFRYLDTKLGPMIRGKLEAIVHDACGRDIHAKIEYPHAYEHPVINTENAHELFKRCALSAKGPAHFIEMDTYSRGSEDFAYFLVGREGGKFVLGFGEDWPRLHSPQFDFNDDALADGVMMFCLLALSVEP